MFEARIAELNRFNEQNPVSYDKRTYTVDEIQDILDISRPTAYNVKDADLQIDILNFFSAFSYNEAIARKTL